MKNDEKKQESNVVKIMAVFTEENKKELSNIMKVFNFKCAKEKVGSKK